MKGQNLSSFEVHQLILGEHDIVKPCTLFIARGSIIVVSRSGISLWAVLLILATFATGLLGLILRSLTLFVGGLIAGIVTGLIVALADFMFRRRRLRAMKRFSPERILKMSEKNLEIRYEKIVKVEVRESKVYPGISLLFPSFGERHKYAVGFVTDEGKYLFILDEGDLQPCLNLIRENSSRDIEIVEPTEDE